MIYVYGVVDESAKLPAGVRGLERAPLRLSRAGDLAAVYSSHRALSVAPSREALLAHEHVVESLMERLAVLPMRFGTRLDGEEPLQRWLAEHRDELVRAFQAIRGRVEFGVRVVPKEGQRVEHQPAASGRAYLMRRLEASRARERAAHAVHEPLAAIAAASALRPDAPPPAILAASYLVERSRAEEFSSRVAELDRQREDLELVCSGPWPPYSFVQSRAG